MDVRNCLKLLLWTASLVVLSITVYCYANLIASDSMTLVNPLVVCLSCVSLEVKALCLFCYGLSFSWKREGREGCDKSTMKGPKIF